MVPRIERLAEKKLLGLRMNMSLSNYRIAELWKNFASCRNSIPHQMGSDLYSLAIYPADYFSAFNPTREFERWALVEVSRAEIELSHGLELLEFTGGLYAIFTYKGPSSDNSIFTYIYTSWLPNSDYELDDRPHVEVLGPGYKNNHPDSEEDIWIPIRPRTS
ncbi:MAG: GyrI-like domain-containing protein [Bacteroidetes bacterium]|nr:GyrI-like domain-containing protein [Bacteroidota bacterium]